MRLERQYTRDLHREVYLRPGTSDRQVWADTFTGLYHVPPLDLGGRDFYPATVLDLGANIGLTSAHYQALWPEADIVAVEMDEESAKLIERNAPGVRVKQYAVSGEGGWGTYNPGARAEAYAFERRVGEDPENATGQYVMSHTLRQVILRSFVHDGQAEDYRPVEFVKMDIEGEEWAIFEHGDWAPLVAHLLVELHPAGGRPDDSDALVFEAIDRLAALGYCAERHQPHPRAVFACR